MLPSTPSFWMHLFSKKPFLLKKERTSHHHNRVELLAGIVMEKIYIPSIQKLFQKINKTADVERVKQG